MAIQIWSQLLSPFTQQNSRLTIRSTGAAGRADSEISVVRRGPVNGAVRRIDSAHEMGKRRDEQACFWVRKGNRKRLRWLLGRHPELRTSNSALLVFAAIWHNRGMLRWLLERGVAPDSGRGDGGNTPLMQAAADGDVFAIEALLEFGANPNALNSASENPLGFAVTWEQVRAIELLVAAGAEINNTDDSGPGLTQLDMAELSGWSEVASVLRRLGAKKFNELSVTP